MGSKTPGNKTKQFNIPCKECDMKFQTSQALRTHTIAKHQIDPLKREYSPESAPKEQKPKVISTPSVAPTSRTSKRLQMKNVTTEQSKKSVDQNTEEKLNKIEFSCPKCSKVFPMYFQALKHIENKHPAYDDISSGSSLKPVRIERPLSMTKAEPSNNNELSREDSPTPNKNTLYCLGCNKKFETIGSFNKHAYFVHCQDGADSMFFKNHKEFHLWKQMLETQVKIKYLALKKTTLQTYYQCNYVSSKNEQNKTYLCPSLVFVKYLQTGIQIRYGMKHYGHSCPEYKLPDEFSHLLTSVIKQDGRTFTKSDFDEIKTNPDADLLNKFQSLMGSITEYASKLNMPHLKQLYNSALQMQSLLNSFDEDQCSQGDPLMGKSMTDDQITNALEGKRTSARLKRKSETRSSVDAKKKKDIKSEPNENMENTGFQEKVQFESPNVTARSSPLLSPSFADSFKQFIGEPATSQESQETARVTRNIKRKEIVKTKIGQFSPKRLTNDEETVVESKPNILPKKQLVVETVVKSKQSAPLKKQMVVEETTEKSKRNILKPSRTNTSVSLVSDIKYEVREQENDCNILILKI